MDNVLIVVGVLCVTFVLFKLIKQTKQEASSKQVDIASIKHYKKEYLATKNEQKLYFALQKALSDKYHIHCQTSLISIVEPVEFKHKKRAYSKRMDFVITDTATKIIAVIELDDSTHNQPKRMARDKYVNEALKPHHPLIRLSTTSFYKPEDIADMLDAKAGIKNIFRQEGNETEAVVLKRGAV